MSFDNLESILRSADFTLASYEKVKTDRFEYFVDRYKLGSNITLKANEAPGARNYAAIDLKKYKGKDGKVRAKVLEKIVKKLASKLGGLIFDAEYTYKSEGDKVTATITPKAGLLEGILYVGSGKYGNFDRTIDVTIDKKTGTLSVTYKTPETKVPQAVVTNDINRIYRGLNAVSSYFTVNPKPDAAAPQTATVPTQPAKPSATGQGAGQQGPSYEQWIQAGRNYIPRLITELQAGAGGD